MDAIVVVTILIVIYYVSTYVFQMIYSRKNAKRLSAEKNACQVISYEESGGTLVSHTLDYIYSLKCAEIRGDCLQVLRQHQLCI